MIWIYYTQPNWASNVSLSRQRILMRAVGTETDEGRMVSNIIEINILALDFYFERLDNPFVAPKYQNIYFKELDKQDYFIENLEIGEDEDYMMGKIVLYLKQRHFTQTEVLEWMRTYLSILGLEWISWEEGDLMSFHETNAILRLFSLRNVQRFEDELGKDWWKDPSA